MTVKVEVGLVVGGLVNPSIATLKAAPSAATSKLGTVMTEPITLQPPAMALPATEQVVGLGGLVTSAGQVTLRTSVSRRGLLGVKVKV